MSGLRGVLAGSLTLIALHTLVAYRGPSQRLGELGRLAEGLVHAFLSPAVPGIPERGATGGKPATVTEPGGTQIPNAGPNPYFPALNTLPAPAPR